VVGHARNDVRWLIERDATLREQRMHRHDVVLDVVDDRRAGRRSILLAVSPGWIKETLVKLGMDPTPGLSAADCAKAYVAAVEGSYQGAIIQAIKP
jgi:hypothetical protein